MQGSKWYLRRVSVIFTVALVTLLTSSPTGAQTRYNYDKVSPPPSYFVVDKEQGGGTFVGAGVDSTFTIQLPFAFTFFGTPYPAGAPIYVSTNGNINFKATPERDIVTGFQLDQVNQCPIPTTGEEPNAAIYPFWDYLAGQVWTQVLGTPPNQQFIIEFSNVSFWERNNPFEFGPSAFEIVLYETTGAIEFRYQNILRDGDLPKGTSATIGIENGNGTLNYQFSCNTAILPSSGDFAIRFDPITDSPPPPPTGKPPVNVDVDIKPKHILNWFNVARQGKLSVAILGKEGFDVKQIDPKNVRLAGVAPLYSWVENVRTHESDGWRRVFHRFGRRDQRLDLILTFDRQAIVAALGSVNNGDVKTLKLSGKLKDGSEFSGQDSIRIINKAKKGKKNDSYHSAWRSTLRHDDDDHDEDDD